MTEEPDWLSSIGPETEEEAPAAEMETEEEDWLADIEPSAEASPDETEAQPMVTRILDSGEDQPDENLEPIEADYEDETENETPVEPAPAQTQILADYEYDFGLTDEPAEPEAEVISDEDYFASQPDYDDVSMEQALAAAPAPPPAENAPDWLNAMVPGLDLDYEATEEDAPLESSYIESGAAHRVQAQVPGEQEGEPARNFDWLVEIVDEETSQFTPIKDEAPEPKRFTFSRQPAWLRVPTEHEDTDESEQDDFELPDWLQ